MHNEQAKKYNFGKKNAKKLKSNLKKAIKIYFLQPFYIKKTNVRIGPDISCSFQQKVSRHFIGSRHNYRKGSKWLITTRSLRNGHIRGLLGTSQVKKISIKEFLPLDKSSISPPTYLSRVAGKAKEPR